MSSVSKFASVAEHYSSLLKEILEATDWSAVEQLADDLQEARASRMNEYICGNGGSAANANHWANDLVYPVTKMGGTPIRIKALSANQAVVTCLANDLGYDSIYEHQLRTFANAGDLLIVLSGSGNSPNILRALEAAKDLKVKSFAVVGFDGGKAKSMSDVPIHFAVDDMQVSEDLQMIVCHIITQYLNLR